MAQGLQCWNAAGQIVVDLGDYNMRYMGATSLNIASGTTNTWGVAFGGMRTTGWLAVPRSVAWGTEFYCIPGNDAFTVRYTPTGYISARTVIFDVYSFG